MNTDHSVVLKTTFDCLCVCTILPILKLVSSLPSSHSTTDSLESSGEMVSSCIRCRCHHGRSLRQRQQQQQQQKCPSTDSASLRFTLTQIAAG